MAAVPPRRSQHHHHHHHHHPPPGPASPPPAGASPPRSPSLAPAEQRHSLTGAEGEAPPDADRPPVAECAEGSGAAAPASPPGSGSSSSGSSSSSSSASSSAASSPAAESPEAAGPGAASGAFRELLEACRNGDVTRVKRLVDTGNVNAKDMAGRKSTPLHFAAGGYRDLSCPARAVVASRDGSPGIASGKGLPATR
ncbi:hypothetical protein TURU_036616 [Turdus rufiventris]|nr:hypothetical protein TURU_036616 [Turdus rufiventris]